jgi:hypothetical protein
MGGPQLSAGLGPGKSLFPAEEEQVVSDVVPLLFRRQDSYLDTTPRSVHTASFALVEFRQPGMKINIITADSTRQHAN